jgi:hypothetical protein
MRHFNRPDTMPRADALRDGRRLPERAGLDVMRIDLAGHQRGASTSVFVTVRVTVTPLPTSISSR